jgi:hypothetical protein
LLLWQQVSLLANRTGLGCPLWVRNKNRGFCITIGCSENQWLVQIQRRLHAKMLDTMVPLIAEHVKTQAVFFHVDQFDQLLLQMDELLIVHGTFKDRVLNALAEIQALLCDISQASLPGFVSSGDIVSDKDEHGGEPDILKTKGGRGGAIGKAWRTGRPRSGYLHANGG